MIGNFKIGNANKNAGYKKDVNAYVAQGLKNKKSLVDIIDELASTLAKGDSFSIKELQEKFLTEDELNLLSSAIPQPLIAKLKLHLIGQSLINDDFVKEISGKSESDLKEGAKSYKVDELNSYFMYLSNLTRAVDKLLPYEQLLKLTVDSSDIELGKRFIIPHDTKEEGKYFTVIGAKDSILGFRFVFGNVITASYDTKEEVGRVKGIDTNLILSLKDIAEAKFGNTDAVKVRNQIQELKNQIAILQNELIRQNAFPREVTMHNEDISLSKLGDITLEESVSASSEWVEIDFSNVTETIENFESIHFETVHLLSQNISRETAYYTRDDLRLAIALADPDVDKSHIRAFFRTETTGMSAILCKCFAAGNGMLYRNDKVSAEVASSVIREYFRDPSKLVKAYYKNICGTSCSKVSSFSEKTKQCIEYIFLKYLKSMGLMSEDLVYTKLDTSDLLSSDLLKLGSLDVVARVQTYKALLADMKLQINSDKAQASNVAQALSSDFTSKFQYEHIEDHLLTALNSVISRVSAKIFKRLYLYPIQQREKFSEPNFLYLCKNYNILALVMNNPSIVTTSEPINWSKEDELVLAMLKNTDVYTEYNVKDFAKHFTISKYRDAINNTASLATISYKVANVNNIGIYDIHQYDVFTRYLSNERLSLLTKSFLNVINNGFDTMYDSILGSSVRKAMPMLNKGMLLKKNISDELLKLFVISQADQIYVDYVGNFRFYFSNRTFLEDPRLDHKEMYYVTSDINEAAFYAIFKNNLAHTSESTFSLTAEKISPTKYYSDIRDQYYSVELKNISAIKGYILSRDNQGKLQFREISANLGLHDLIRAHKSSAVTKVLIDKRLRSHLSSMKDLLKDLTQLGDFVSGLKARSASTGYTFDLVNGKLDLHSDTEMNNAMNMIFQKAAYTLLSGASKDYAQVGLVTSLSLSVYHALLKSRQIESIDYVNGYDSLDRTIVNSIRLAVGKILMSMAIETIYANSTNPSEIEEKEEILEILDIMLKVAVYYAHTQATMIQEDLNATIY